MDRKYACIAPDWRGAWAEVVPFFAFDPAIRKIIYTMNVIESLNRVIRKSIKTRGSFPEWVLLVMPGMIRITAAAQRDIP